MRSVALVVLTAVPAWCATLPWRSVRRVPRVAAPRAGDDRRGAAPGVDGVLLLDLVDAALGTGVAVPRALGAVGSAVGGTSGDALRRAGSALVLGASWSAAWEGAGGVVAELADVLEPAWSTGTAPSAALRARADRLRRARRAAVREAAARLGVHLVLPLGLCVLPAFVLLGLVPVVVSLAHGLLG